MSNENGKTQNTLLSRPSKRATIKRKIEIYSEIARHLKAILYLVAELHLGEKPETL